MPKLTIDNRQVTVPAGATILEAAAKLGIEIPTLCFRRGCEPSTSCMVCVVKVEGMAGLVPACATVAAEGMKVDSSSQQVRQARKAALELLLSDHLGDCMGPCQVTCPARMNIPLMIRQIAAGRLADAIATVKADIALPAVLGRICPKPCEKSCRRAAYDEAVSICLLKRYVADVDLQSKHPYIPARGAERGKRIAIVGAGPAGLAAAYYLAVEGFSCTIFDEHEQPGGALRYAIPPEELPPDVLDAELGFIDGLDIRFEGRTCLGRSVSMEELRRDFDAVFVAIGKLEAEAAGALGLETAANGIAIESGTYRTSLPGVFAGGDAVRARRLAVRAVADGKEAAVSIAQYVLGREVTGPDRPFNTRIGRLEESEIAAFVRSASDGPRVQPSGEDGGFSADQAVAEAARCLHCDCRKPDRCRLRRFAKDYGAKASRYRGPRRTFVQETAHPEVIYEPGKCIDCGTCIQIAAAAGERLGLTFVGRGFDVRVAVPFGRGLDAGLEAAALQCAEACPTGALARKD